MNRFSKKHVVYFRLLMDFIYCTFFLVFLSLSFYNPEVENDPNFDTRDLVMIRMILIGIYVLTLIFFIVYRLLYYKYSFYELKDKQIYTTRGVIFKKKSYLDYSKIHSVNKKQSFIQKIFKVSTLLIDSGSTNTSYSAEICIFEDDDKVNELMKIIDLKQNNEAILSNSVSLEENTANNINNDNKELLFSYAPKNKVLEIVLTALSVFFGLLVIGIIFFIMIIFVNYLLKIINYREVFESLVLFAMTIGSIVIVTMLGGIIGMFIGYYDFKIYKENENINISYGLLQKNFNKFKIDKVKAVIIKQSLIKRLFNYCSVEVEVIGYGETGQNNSVNRILIPICKENEVEGYIRNIFPKYNTLEINNKCKSYFSLFSFYLLFTGSIFGITYLLGIPYLISYNLLNEILYSSLILLGVLIVLLILFIIYSKFAYYVQGVNLTDDKITIYHGALSKVKTTILKENLIGITRVTTPFRLKKHIYTYIIHFRSNSNFNTVKVRCLDEQVGNQILNLIKF